ncbi:hypothetical protein LINPERPRIM_LOCUS18798, partial [Linum perenne]
MQHQRADRIYTTWIVKRELFSKRITKENHSSWIIVGKYFNIVQNLWNNLASPSHPFHRWSRFLRPCHTPKMSSPTLKQISLLLCYTAPMVVTSKRRRKE